MKLDLNQRVLIRSETLLKGKKIPAVITRIEKDYLGLDLPAMPLAIKAGTMLTVYFWDDRTVYSFTARTITEKSKIVTSFNIERPVNIKMTFKRAFKRIEVKLKGELLDIDGLTKERCFITDLSASGAKTIARAGKKVGTMARISFDLKDGQDYDGIDIVIVRAKLDKNPGLMEYGFSFSGISKLRQERLNDFIIQRALDEEGKEEQ